MDAVETLVHGINEGIELLLNGTNEEGSAKHWNISVGLKHAYCVIIIVLL